MIAVMMTHAAFLVTHGDTIDKGPVLKDFPLLVRSLREYARRVRGTKPLVPAQFGR